MPTARLSILLLAALPSEKLPEPVGPSGKIGCTARATRVSRLRITEPGNYADYLVDGAWADGNLVQIRADDVVLSHCEIRNGRHNGVLVSGRNVIIDSCRIHHLLKGTFQNQQDAHGITGRPNGLIIRNCEIYYVSGDAVQFDPDRTPWSDVIIDRCSFWTGPLPAAAAGFQAGQRPGENAVDTKQRPSHPRSKILIQNCVFRGWSKPAQISNIAALNIKDHVWATIQNCVFLDNEICLRLRGPGTASEPTKSGGAVVRVSDCVLFDSQFGFRLEDNLKQLTILRCGHRVKRFQRSVSGDPDPDFVSRGHYALPRDQLLRLRVKHRDQ